MTSTLSWVPRVSISNNIIVTPTITAASYSAGVQLGGIMTLSNAVRWDSNTGLGTSYLMSVTVVDRSGTSPLIDVWFFSASPTLVSSDHAAFNIANSQIGQCVGAITVGGAYSTSAGTNGVSLDGNGILKLMSLSATTQASTNSSLYAVAILRTPAGVTFLTTTDVTFEFGFSID